jgi:hypothetical protein
MNVLYEDGMNVPGTVCTRKYQNKQKEWHHATKPLKNRATKNLECLQNSITGVQQD